MSIAVVALSLLTVHLVLTRMAKKASERAHRAWTEAGLPLEGYLQSRPPQTDSPAATRLVQTVADLGFSIAVQTEPIEIPQANGASWDHAKAEIKEYCDTELARPESDVCPPPEPVAGYLEQNAATLAEVRRQLEAEVPRWRLQLHRGQYGDIPNLLGNLDLARVLIADALTAHARGNDAVAVHDIKAAWQLSEGFGGNPTLISQLILLAVRRFSIITIRKLDGIPAGWSERLQSWDPGPGMERAIQFEAASQEILPKPRTPDDIEPCGCPDLSPADAGRWEAGALLTMLSEPYFRLCTARTAEIDAALLLDVRSLGRCASTDRLVQKGDPKQRSLSAWNPLAISWVKDLSDVFRRVVIYRIQAELTVKVLELKAHRDASGAWPQSVPGIERSFCPDKRWIYTVTPDGGLSLVLDNPPPREKKKRGFWDPWEYREPPPPTRSTAR